MPDDWNGLHCLFDAANRKQLTVSLHHLTVLPIFYTVILLLERIKHRKKLECSDWPPAPAASNVPRQKDGESVNFCVLFTRRLVKYLINATRVRYFALLSQRFVFCFCFALLHTLESFRFYEFPGRNHSAEMYYYILYGWAMYGRHRYRTCRNEITILSTLF